MLHAGFRFAVKARPRRGIVIFASFGPNSNGDRVTTGVTVSLTVGGGGILLVSNSLHRNSASVLVRDPNRKLDSCLGNEVTSVRSVLCGNRRGKLIGGFSIVPVKAVPPGPARLLFAPLLRRVVGAVHRRCSCMFVSYPPVRIITSAPVCRRFTSHAVFIIHTNLVRHDVLPRIGTLCGRGGFGGVALVLGKAGTRNNECNDRCNCNCNCNCNCGCGGRGGKKTGSWVVKL